MTKEQLKQFVELCSRHVDGGCPSCAYTAVLCLVVVKPELENILADLWIEVAGTPKRFQEDLRDDFKDAATKGEVW